jgi:hypothetical protein
MQTTIAVVSFGVAAAIVDCGLSVDGHDEAAGDSDAADDSAQGANAPGVDGVAPPAGGDAAADADTTPRGVPDGGRRVFVSTGMLTPGTNGFPAAQLCSAEATDAGLPGTYVPWISTASVDAIDQLLEWRWYLVDGTPVADSRAELTGDAGLRAPISQTATGVDLSASSQPFVWTGTQTNGRRVTTYGATCLDWAYYDGQGTTGRLDRSDANWTMLPQAQWKTCTVPGRVYCFQN